MGDNYTDDGSSILIHAISGGNPQAVDALLRARANPSEANEDGLTPLVLAGEKGNLEAAMLLVEARADVNAFDDEWGSALDCAEKGGHAELAAFLTSVGVTRAAELQTTGDRGGERKAPAAGERWGYDAFDGEEDY